MKNSGCINCYWFRIARGLDCDSYWCVYPTNYKTTMDSISDGYEVKWYPEEKNKNRDCEYFEPTKFTFDRFLDFFRLKVKMPWEYRNFNKWRGI